MMSVRREQMAVRVKMMEQLLERVKSYQEDVLRSVLNE